ncbi:MAG: hypothetical protein GTO15_04370 [Pseudomonas stutzeri]|nr:hypothetical protein [Stutzerimonas stutzeri]
MTSSCFFLNADFASQIIQRCRCITLRTLQAFGCLLVVAQSAGQTTRAAYLFQRVLQAPSILSQLLHGFAGRLDILAQEVAGTQCQLNKSLEGHHFPPGIKKPRTGGALSIFRSSTGIRCLKSCKLINNTLAADQVLSRINATHHVMKLVISLNSSHFGGSNTISDNPQLLPRFIKSRN